MYQLINIFKTYSNASGQKINLLKSRLICGRSLHPQIRTRLAAILNFQMWEDPGKYLGLPGDWGKSRNEALMWIRERISSKLEGWKTNILNQAGKEVLIKAVIQAIPTYAMSIIQFPKNFCKGICSKIARFWWRSNNRERGMHWKAWKSLAVSKKEGGMGFKDFNVMNSAHLAKQAWRVIQNPTALWVQVLQSIYYPNGSFIQAGRSRNDSWVWASLVHGKKMLLQQSRWLVGKGDKLVLPRIFG